MDPGRTPRPPPPPSPPAAPPSPHPHMQSQSPSGNADNVTHFSREPDPDDSPNHHQRQNRAMANFRAFVMKMAASDPTRPLTEDRKSLIEKRLSEFFPDTHTPDHPTYASMIYRAILELNEEGGSSEESISQFIKNEHDDLPWAHSTFLKHHLWKLCERGEIVVTSEKCYLLGDAITKLRPDQSAGASPTREQLKMKQRKGRGRPRKKDVIKELQVIEEQNQLTEEWNNVFEEPNQPKGGKDEVIVDQNRVVEQQHEANKQQNQAELQNEAVESEPKEQESGGSDEWNQPQKQDTGIRAEQKQPEEEQNDETKGQTPSKEQDQWQEQEVKVIKEQSQQLEQQNEAIGEQNQVEGHYGDVRGETLQFCSKVEHGVGDGLRDLPIESPGTMDKEKKEGQQRRSPCQEGEFIDICGLSVQQQPELPRLGRTPESKPIEELSWLQGHQQQRQEQEKPQHRQLLIRLRLPQPEPARVTTVVESLPLEHLREDQQEPDCGGLSRPAVTLLNVAATTGESSTADRQHQNERQQPVWRGRGRPPKLKPEGAATAGYQHTPQQEKSKHRGRGRPPKCKSPAGRNMEDSQKQQQPKRQGRGRPRKLDSGIQGQ